MGAVDEQERIWRLRSGAATVIVSVESSLLEFESFQNQMRALVTPDASLADIHRLVADTSRAQEIHAIVIEVSKPTAHRNLARLIEGIQHSRTADQAFMRLEALFEIAGESEIDELSRSEEAPAIREYIGSVIGDLDEHADESRTRLKSLLPPDVGHLLVP